MPGSSDAILLRSADEPDRYLAAFEQAGLQAACEPVLRFTFPNQSALRSALNEGESEPLIATSPRVGTALARLSETNPALQNEWEGRTAYAVGPKTADRLQALGFTVRGAEAGSAEALAEEILDDASTTPLLFLSGNRRRDVLPNRLRAANVPFREIVVYETHTRDDLTLPPSDGSTWLVFFSPSGLDAVEQDGTIPLSEYRVAAIGPTTGGALRAAGISVEAVADEPSPAALVAALQAAADGD